MISQSQIQKYLKHLVALYGAMESHIDQPEFVDIQGVRVFRYRTHTDSLACFLKGIKMVSTLNASLVLLREGYTQEIGALCRIIDDLHNEILFLQVLETERKLSDDQIKLLNDFYQEEFDNMQSPFNSTQKRDTVPAKKIHAAIGRLAETIANPSDMQELSRTLNRSYSGYVHGAYIHIMEMFGGSSTTNLHFHTEGMLGTPRIAEWQEQFGKYLHRALITAVFVARKLGLSEIEVESRRILEDYEQSIGFDASAKPADMLKNLKKKAT